MKRLLLILITVLSSQFLLAQKNFSIDFSVMHRTDETSKKTFSTSEGSSFQYYKTDMKVTPRLYSLEIPDDCIFAKIQFIALKNGVEINSREQKFSKASPSHKFSFSHNARMGPYMKNLNEDEIRIKATVYQKTEDGYHKISTASTTISLKLNLERELLAENK